MLLGQIGFAGDCSGLQRLKASQGLKVLFSGGLGGLWSLTPCLPVLRALMCPSCGASWLGLSRPVPWLISSLQPPKPQTLDPRP